MLIDEVGYIRLTDFGLSKMFVESNDALSICGTPEYLAPEILYKEGHGKPVDWWCLGCIIFEMITGLPPFYSKSRNELFDKIKFSNPNIPAFSSAKLKSLLEGLFQKKVENRLGSKGAEEIKKHPFFEKTNWDVILKKEVKAPFVPVVKSQVDVSNFDIEFTQCAIESHKEELQEECKQYFGRWVVTQTFRTRRSRRSSRAPPCRSRSPPTRARSPWRSRSPDPSVVLYMLISCYWEW